MRVGVEGVGPRAGACARVAAKMEDGEAGWQQGVSGGAGKWGGIHPKAIRRVHAHGGRGV